MSTGKHPTKAERKASAKEKIEEMRRQEERRAKMVRVGIAIATVVVVLLAAGGIVLALKDRNKPAATPSNLTARGGVLIYKAAPAAPAPSAATPTQNTNTQTSGAGSFGQAMSINQVAAHYPAATAPSANPTATPSTPAANPSTPEIPASAWESWEKAQQEEQQRPPIVIPPTTPGPGEPAVTITEYFDFMCPACRSFSDAASAELDKRRDAGQIAVEYVPVAILNDTSRGTEFSSRSGGAAFCVAEYDRDKLPKFNEAMYANQPSEGTRGLDNGRIEEIAGDVGANDKVKDCIKDETFRKYMTQGTEHASKDGLRSTPLILLNGTEFKPKQDWSELFTAIDQAVAQAAGGTGTPSAPGTGTGSGAGTGTGKATPSREAGKTT